MPTYEYVCTKCGNRLETFVRFGDPEPTECPVCGSALRKVFHPAGILFKGSGFYKTDNRSSSKRSSDKPAASDSKSSGESKSSGDSKSSSSDPSSGGSKSGDSKPASTSKKKE